MKYRIFEDQYGDKRSVQHIQSPVWIRLLDRFSTHRLQVVSDMVPKKKVSILEIGCGDGTFLYENRQKWKNIVGVDVVSSQLRKAKTKKYGCPFCFLQKDFGRELMPLKNKQYDICVSIATLQYIYDIDILFSEVYRVLKNGGLFIFEVPNITVFWRRCELLLGRLPKTSNFINGWDAGSIHYFTYQDMKKFCLQKGFTVDSVQTSGFMSWFRRLWPDMLGADLVFACRKK